MSVTRTPLVKRLQIRWNTGLDEEFNPVYRIRSWSNLNTAGTDQQIFDLALFIDALCEHTLNSARINTVDEIDE